MEKAKVFFTKDISSEGLEKIYKSLNVELNGISQECIIAANYIIGEVNKYKVTSVRLNK